ncbi:Pycsar system effector family protein [Dyadobacter chenhuakuii]|uniref:DUF5706 domain-containing protein n=1 Tax=Dyadobacter chenhuakuii TaxID=2909339 RepID=A0A9X1Q912_9BACT|nr:Pycsar system effector family protein [Dyadobacter chenhuakuii]MCF2496724.1 DUF5706 domain-containing protein [Dyadobacter chenhuakuii]
MSYKEALQKIKAKVTGDFVKAPNPGLHFHTLLHTKKVVKRARKIGKHYKLEKQPLFILLAAAWFHDVGYLYGKSSGHEHRGAEIAGSYLKGESFGAQLIDSVKNTIRATIVGSKMEDLSAQILCDADLYHLGTKVFFKQNNLVKKEWEDQLNERISSKDWQSQTISFLESHQFQTTYCQEKLTNQKQKNLQRLKDKSKTHPDPEKHKEDLMDVQAEKKSALKMKRPERGIETMLRITSSNHQRLSDMADNKAHIMITANSIIISVMISILLRKLEDNPNLTIPTIILLTVCVSSMVFGILSTRPSLPKGIFSEEQLNSRKVNLLFFGNFYKMDLASYDQGMRVMMDDSDFLYGSMIRDIHSQGNVLGKKYQHLRLAYSIFMFGIITSVVAFVLASMII